jgi:PmbA protein
MEQAELAIKKALKMGMTEAEAYSSRSLTTRLEFDDKIRGFKTVESTGISLRVALGKRIASYSTSILEEKEVDNAVERAVKIAKVAPEDPNWQHLNKTFSKASAEEYYDRTVEVLEQAEIVDTIRTAVAHIRDFDKRITPSLGSLTTVVAETTIANSHGHSSDRKETSVTASLRAKAEEAGLQSSGIEREQARSWKTIDFKTLAVKAADQAIRFLKARPAENSKVPVIIRNQVFADMLGVMLSGPTNADWVQMGRSPLADKLNRKIASDSFTMVDDGLLRGGLQTKPFDDEGHPTQTTSVLDKGVLRSFLYDNYTGLKAGIRSTGNALRSNYWTEPSPAPSNLILKPGTARFEDIICDTKDGIYVELTIGEWLSDPVSGNLSATVTHGYNIKNGELTDTIKGAIISGSFYELLKDGVEMVGNDLRNSGQYYSPIVKLSGLTIAGKE